VAASGPSTVGHRMGTDSHRVARTRTLSGLLQASPRDLRQRWSEGPTTDDNFRTLACPELEHISRPRDARSFRRKQERARRTTVTRVSSQAWSLFGPATCLLRTTTGRAARDPGHARSHRPMRKRCRHGQPGLEFVRLITGCHFVRVGELGHRGRS